MNYSAISNVINSEQEGFLRCQTPTSTVRLNVEEYRVKNGGYRLESEKGGCWIKSKEWMM